MAIRIVVADDHPIVLAGLRQLFRAEPDFDIVAEARDGHGTLDAVRRLRPDILVLDLRMPGKDGLDVLRELKHEDLPTRVVALTAVDDEVACEAVRLGIQGIVLKDMAPELLVQCVREVHAGHRWLERGVAARALDALSAREHGAREMAHALTHRELEVARMAAEGLANKEIARKLDITEGTAKLHLHHVYEKLNLRGRVALLRYLQAHGAG